MALSTAVHRSMLDPSVINSAIGAHPYPLLFATMSGAHLYGFSSPDSDYDIRGCHVTPARKMLELSEPDLTHEVMDKTAPIEIDLVTHDIRKFFQLLIKNNGYVLEQVMSPLVVASSPEFEQLKTLAPRTITRHHHHHFRNFGQNQWDLVIRNGKPTVKGLLYTYRVLLAGTHLMRTGEVESNLVTLNQTFKLSYIDDLIARKIAGAEKGLLQPGELARHEAEFDRLKAELDLARDQTRLPEVPSCRDELNQLLVRTRLKYL
jgi:uncharacterized protein